MRIGRPAGADETPSGAEASSRLDIFWRIADDEGLGHLKSVLASGALAEQRVRFLARARLAKRLTTMIRYIELESGYHDDGPAWIARVAVSKSGRTRYFNGKALKRSTQAGSGNYYDVVTAESYWISGVKKKGGDRHWAGRGKITIDAGAVDEHLQITGGLSWIRRHSLFQQRSSHRTPRHFTIWRTSHWHRPMVQFDQSESKSYSAFNSRCLQRAGRFAHFRLRTSFGRRS